MKDNLKDITCMILSLGMLASIFSCQEKPGRHDEIQCIKSEDTTILVKISYPEKWTQKDKIIVWSLPPLTDNFLPDSITNNRELWSGPVLRNIFLNSGYVNIEYLGRNDSTMILNRKYRASEIYTKAQDLDNLLDYIRKDKHLHDKKIILAGYSEGGDITCVTGKKRSDITAMLQLVCNALPKKEMIAYQREPDKLFEQMLQFTRNMNQKYMDQVVNKLTSLDSYHTTDMDGFLQFHKENIEPVENFIYQFENRDSIYVHMDLYLRERWDKEDQETKEFAKNFETYYTAFAGNITPQQISIRTFEPENYYPFITCPVLAVQGTEDRRINCYPNTERMEQILAKGGNRTFKKLILEGYSHALVKWDKNTGNSMEDHVADQIVKWLDEL